jgi:hypothetical protein
VADQSRNLTRAGVAGHVRASGQQRCFRDVSVAGGGTHRGLESVIKDARPEYHYDLDYLISMLDWEANVNPEFAKTNKVFPKPLRPVAEMKDHGYSELWITYGTGYYSAKELTVLPKRKVNVRDSAAYGLILTQGFSKFGKHTVATPSMIRFGETTEDELFVTADAAQQGVVIENSSDTDPLVILKHFGPANPDAEPLRKKDK